MSRSRTAAPLLEPVHQHPVLNDLNPEQREAAVSINNPTLVLSPAGTGKTSVLAARYKYLVAEGMQIPSILALTFSNKAAGEMRERVGDILEGYEERAIYIMTFHTLGKRIIESRPHMFGLTEKFRVAEDAEQQTIMHEAVRAIDPDSLENPTMRNRVSSLLKIVDDIKSAGMTPSQLAQHRRFKGRTYDAVDVEVLEEYDQRLTNENMVDFNDLILKPILAFRSDAKFANSWNRAFKAVMVDEYQDTNAIQYALLRFLTEGKRNILFLGDDDQQIYDWRGGNSAYVINFEQEWDDPVVVKLLANYRNGSRILQIATNMISHNKNRRQKNITASVTSTGICEMRAFEDVNEEHAWIVDHIEQAKITGVPLDQIAILTRTREEASKIGLTLASHQIPHYNPENDLLNCKEVRGLIKWARVMMNENDRLSMQESMHMPPCGYDARSVHSLVDASLSKDISLVANCREMLAKGLATPDGPTAKYLARLALVQKLDPTHPGIFRMLSEVCGLDEYVETRAEGAKDMLRAAIQIFDDMHQQLGSLSLVLDAIALNAAGIGKSHGADPKVQVNTMHASKGLEFHTIIAPGWEEGQFPYDSRNVDEIEEARRLAYVTMTRARSAFYATACRSRPHKGNLQPSRFLTDAGLDGPAL